MKTRLHLTVYAMMVGLLLSFPLIGETANYEFTKIADTNSILDEGYPIDGIADCCPSINNLGIVSFYIGFVVDPTHYNAICTGDGDSIQIIIDTRGEFRSLGLGWPINDDGIIAFNGSKHGNFNHGMFTVDSNGLVTTIIDSTNLRNAADRQAINNQGVVAFHVGLLNGVDGIFTGNGGPLTTIVDTTGPIQGFAHAPLSINDQDTVAFYANLDVGGSGIFAGNGQSLNTIADSSGQYIGFGLWPSINDKGIVAFQASNFEDWAILINDEGSLTKIVDISGPFNGFEIGPSINNQDTVAFRASLDAGGSGIFIGPDPVTDKVISIGDHLFESTVAEIAHFDLNDFNQIAFYARLANGTRGIYRADSVTEPTPITVYIDIKPGSDTNCINNNGHGVIPVAILGSADFDCTKVDPTSCSLEGLGLKIVGKGNKYLAHIEDVNNDGFDDLVLQVEDTDAVFQVGQTEATLTGNLYEEYGGTAIEGTDFICIVP